MTVQTLGNEGERKKYIQQRFQPDLNQGRCGPWSSYPCTMVLILTPIILLVIISQQVAGQNTFEAFDSVFIDPFYNSICLGNNWWLNESFATECAAEGDCLGDWTLNCTSGVNLLLEAGQAGCAPSSKVSKRSTWQQRETVTAQQRHMQREHTKGLEVHHPHSLLCVGNQHFSTNQYHYE